MLSAKNFFDIFSGVSWKLAYFEVGDVAVVYLESDRRAPVVKPRQTRCTWVHCDATVLLVVDDAQDVRVPAYENLGRIAGKQSPYLRSIMARIAADVSHVHIRALHLKPLLQRIYEPCLLVVHIATYGNERLEGGYALRQFVEPMSPACHSMSHGSKNW